MTKTPGGSIESFLEQAASRGLITADQLPSLRALASESTAGAPEIPRGFNWVTVTYALGALLVVFAAGWFLADRWLSLGPAGVLGIIVVYAAIASAASRWLERREFPEAASIAAMVAVSLTPVAVWAIESLSGLWPVEKWGQPYYPYYPAAEASRWVIAELATILAALLVLRKRSWSALIFPIAIALFGLVMHIPRMLVLEMTPTLERWVGLTAALTVCCIADATDRRVPRDGTPGRGDMAFPLWLVGLATLGFSLLTFWPYAGTLRHALPVLAVGTIALSLAIGRRTHLAFGVLLIFLYLMYLAGEVFRSTAYFPIVLALLGGALLFATVWLQRRFPALASSLAARWQGRGGLPGSAVLPWLVVVVTLGITLLRWSESADERINTDFQQRLYILRHHSGSLRAPPTRKYVPGPRNPNAPPPPVRPPG